MSSNLPSERGGGKKKKTTSLKNSQVCCLVVMSKSGVLGVVSLLMLQSTSDCNDQQTLSKNSSIFHFFSSCYFTPLPFSKWNAASLLEILLHFGSLHIICFCFTKEDGKKRLFGSPWYSWPAFFTVVFSFLFKLITHNCDPYWLLPTNLRVCHSLWKEVKYLTLIIQKSIRFQVPT